MAVSPYEHLLAAYSDHRNLITLLKQFRPYLELLPSLRRPSESVISLPLPLIRVRETAPICQNQAGRFLAGDLVHLPCDVGVVMCDPEWKIKTGADIFIFIHRPQEGFAALLRRWRQTQVWIDGGYDWVMPVRYQHIFSESALKTYPLFVLTADTPEYIGLGLSGMGLPYIEASGNALDEASESSLDLPQPDWALDPATLDGPAESADDL
ncbi:MAG: hypothetical protein AAF289_07165 [Cyanobacteria bacterium P01_A01_bin.135]